MCVSGENSFYSGGVLLGNNQKCLGVKCNSITFYPKNIFDYCPIRHHRCKSYFHLKHTHIQKKRHKDKMSQRKGQGKTKMKFMIPKERLVLFMIYTFCLCLIFLVSLNKVNHIVSQCVFNRESLLMVENYGVFVNLKIMESGRP